MGSGTGVQVGVCLVCRTGYGPAQGPGMATQRPEGTALEGVFRISITSVRQVDGLTISVEGEFDSATTPLAVATTAMLPVEPRLVVDMQDVTFFDSTGLRWLLELHVRADHAGGQVVVIPSDAVRTTLELGGLDFLRNTR